MSRTAEGSRITVQRPGSTSRGFREAVAFWLGGAASASVSRLRRSGELVLAQPEESLSIIVTENSARVWRCAAQRPREFARAIAEAPVERMPALVSEFLAAWAHTRATACARSIGVAAAVEAK